ncbi:putative tetratricopeptide-like helical domain, uvrD-like Helicase, ATP-binding protein [Rosa chinensis]|uniref:Putative tetratricopeptide-like helical domain, uvrD-like Helicase, ATP-binding protein n=1 Tax=Rosa chinensis TaxID=74649 RepID=A0A2P6R4I3_ROSCH|nr:putative tetratricopeptide-like helical domain, uvrD-like Helicase, ATP-binding protein [Rosa chinensis]
MKYFEGDLEVPMSWPASLDVIRYKDLSVTSDSVDDVSKDKSYVENSKVSESFLLMKFYSLSSGVVNHLLSDREGRELVLPFEVTDEEMEAILYNRSAFIVGRSGTGKTTVLTMKLYQKEQYYNMAKEGLYAVVQSSGGSNATVLRQIFVTVSPKLCFAIKQHVSNLRSFASGVSCHSAEFGSIGLDDYDDAEAEFRDLPNSFLDIPSERYPLIITFHKFLMMLDGSLSNSYFERFLDNLKLPRRPPQSSRSLKSLLRTKEVNYERFCSSYWPHFNMKLTKRLDALRVITEIISHIKGGLRALEAGNGKLSQSDYVKMSECRASNLCQKEREIIYDIFQVYEKMKTRNGEYDIADFVIDIHRRLQREKYKGDEINFVYIDEVQDLTMSQIMLFKHICSNVEEGFVFSGDTAQTISKGIDFRFQDIRHLFYKKFVLDSRSNEHNERNDKAEISKMFHLSQNFRTHGGVILVRDATVQKEISNSFGKQALVLTIVECKGLEFQDVLLYKYFGSSPLINEWRLIYNYMKEHDLLSPTLHKSIPTFDRAKHNFLCSELKQLYVAISRTRNRLWIYEDMEGLWNPMFDYWIKKCLVQVRQLDDSLVEKMKVSSSAEEWKSRGMKLYHERNYEMANMCFQNAHDTYWERRSKAGSLKVMAYCMQTSNPEKAKSILREAAEIFEDIGMANSAAQCFFDSGDYDVAGRIYYHKCGKQARERAAECFFLAERYESAAEIFQSIGMAESAARCYYELGQYERAGTIYLEDCGDPGLERAGECFYLAGCYKGAADAYGRGNFLSDCLSVCLKGKLFDIGLKYIKSWKQHARKEHDLAIRGELEFLESCAFHYYEVEDTRSNMKSVRSEMLSSRKILNAHLSSSPKIYLWDDKLIRDFRDLKIYLKVKQSEKQFSVDSLVYFWNVWKDMVVYLIEYFESVETQAVNRKRTYGDFFLNYLGVWRQFHDDLCFVYSVLISDANWVRGMDKRSFQINGELVTIDVWQIISAAHSYWTSELLSVGIRILNKVEALYRVKSDSVFCQSWCLTQIYVVAKCLLESKYLKLRNEDSYTLQNFVELSSEDIVACIFPPDWRKSVRENMITHRQKDTSKSLLKQVVVDLFTSSKKNLSYGQVGRLAMIILGSGNFDDDELYKKLMKNLKCSPLWKVFIQNLCGSIIAKQKGYVLINTSQEKKDVSLVQGLHQALAETYYANWREVNDYISPDGFFYLIECLLMWVSCFQGFVITTKSCFIEWLMQKEDTKLTASVLADVLISFEPILMFLIDVVREVLYDKKTMVEWIQRSISQWEECHSLLILRSVIGNDLVVASFGVDCSRFFCPDSISVEMKTNLCSNEILRKLFQRPHIHDQYSQGQTIIGEVCSPVPSAYDSEETKVIGSPRLLLPNSGVVEDEVQHTGNSNKSDLPMGFDALWDKFKSFKLVEKDGQRSLLSDASAFKLFVGKIIFLLTAVWLASFPNAVDIEEQIVSREVLSMLDELMQLYAALHGSEKELGNKMSTVAKLSAKLLVRRQRMEPMFFWPEKREAYLQDAAATGTQTGS